MCSFLALCLQLLLPCLCQRRRQSPERHFSQLDGVLPALAAESLLAAPVPGTLKALPGPTSLQALPSPEIPPALPASRCLVSPAGLSLDPQRRPEAAVNFACCPGFGRAFAAEVIKESRVGQASAARQAERGIPSAWEEENSHSRGQARGEED